MRRKAALKAAGCEVIRAETRSGTTTDGRTELQTVLDFVRKGDVLMVTRVDRLARRFVLLHWSPRAQAQLARSLLKTGCAVSREQARQSANSLC